VALRTDRVRRTTDLIEDVAAWILVAAALLVVLLSCGIGVRVHNQFMEQSRTEAAERVPSVARLLAEPPLISSRYGHTGTTMMPATWKDHLGVSHTGFVAAPRGLGAGSTVPIWTDASGAQAPAPTSEDDALLSSLIASGVALGVGICLLVGLWALVCRATLTANCVRWEQEWREVAPVWARGEGTRG
jgi:hypothetical protein